MKFTERLLNGMKGLALDGGAGAAIGGIRTIAGNGNGFVDKAIDDFFDPLMRIGE